MGAPPLDEQRHVSLVEVLDRVLDKGAVIAGDVTISVAEIALVRLHLQVVLGSAGTLDVQVREQQAELPASAPSEGPKP